MTTSAQPIRTVLEPLYPQMLPAQAEAVRAVVAMFPDAYRAGAVDALQRVSGELRADEAAGVPLTTQRLIAAFNQAIAAFDSGQQIPDVWARE